MPADRTSLVDKTLPANAGDMGSIPGPGRSHMPRGNQAHGPQLSPHPRARAQQEEKPHHNQRLGCHNQRVASALCSRRKPRAATKIQCSQKLNKKHFFKEREKLGVKVCQTSHQFLVSCILDKKKKAIFEALASKISKPISQTEGWKKVFIHNWGGGDRDYCDLDSLYHFQIIQRNLNYPTISSLNHIILPLCPHPTEVL